MPLSDAARRRLDRQRDHQIQQLQYRQQQEGLTEKETARLMRLLKDQQRFAEVNARRTAERQARNASPDRKERSLSKKNAKARRLNLAQQIANSTKRVQGLQEYLRGLTRRAERQQRTDVVEAVRVLEEQLQAFLTTFPAPDLWTRANLEPYRVRATELNDCVESLQPIPKWLPQSIGISTQGSVDLL